MISLIVLFSFMPLYAQDSTISELVKEIGLMSLKIDSLNRQVINPLNDTILKMDSIHHSTLSKMQTRISLLEEDTMQLHLRVKILDDSIGKLNNNQIIIERNLLLLKVDSLKDQITKLNSMVSEKDQQVSRERERGVEKAIQAKEKGKVEIILDVMQIYSKPFDELAKSTRINIIDRDLSIFQVKDSIPDVLYGLQRYFSAELVLSEKFNKQKVNAALTIVDSLEQTELVYNLKDKLELYEDRNEGLKEAIKKIIDIDSQFIANDFNTKQMKVQRIFNQFSDYFYNFRFDFSDYPYLSEIIFEIMNQKQSDANADIRHFIDKL